MAGLSHADLRAVLELVRRIESVPDLSSFHAELITGLTRLIPCDVAHLGQLDGEAGQARAIDHPTGAVGADAAAGLARNFTQHPTLTRQLRADRRALRISDFIGLRRFTRTALYDECHRLIGTRHELRVRVPSEPPNATWLVVHRSARDFSERDREVLSLLRPQYGPARRNAELRQLQLVRERFDGEALGVALLSPADAVIAANRTAERLGAACGVRSGRLPVALAAWVRRQRAEQNGEGRRAGGPLHVDGVVVAHFLPGRDAREPDAVILEQRRPRGAALTAREAEIVELVAAGRTDMQIARELGISPRTVQKHLERVYRKLDAPNRTAALARAGRITRP